MDWFRRKKPKPAGRPSRSAASSRASSGRDRPAGRAAEADWRSYDPVAADYARIHGPRTASIAADVFALVDAGDQARVLDVGTGSADALAVAAPATVVGVDESVGMLRHAGGARVAAAEAINLPFRDATFDGATANFALPYFTKLDTALFEIARVMRPGAKLGVAVWAAGEDDLTKTWRIMLEETIGRDILKAGLKDETPWAEALSDKARLEGVLRDAGFRPVTVEPRRYRFEIGRDDYIRGVEIEAAGRYAKAMLGDRLWESFRTRLRDAYADRFPESLVDFRDVLVAVATKPGGPKIR